MLSERKLKILQAIIQDYIETAEPVGSRTLSKKHDLGISPATIRNEMADLEELGFIIQPHTSAGRIPSDKGYRLYVDQFMPVNKANNIEDQQMELDFKKRVGEIQELLEYSSKILSQLTNYTSIGLAPRIGESKLEHIQLLPIDEGKILSVMITDSGAVKKSIIIAKHKQSKNSLQKISNLLNDKLNGKTIKDIEGTIIELLGDEIIKFDNSINKIIDEVFEPLNEINHGNMFFNGAMNIFNFPEYNDIFKAKSFLTLLEDKQLLSSLIRSFSGEGLNISIGSENIYKEAQEYSLVTATYKVDTKTLGWLSVIGPTRMDYSTVVSAMAEVSNYINELLKGRYK